MSKKYDIRNIDELHKLRAELYEEHKKIPPQENMAKSNARGREYHEKLLARKRAMSSIR